MALYRRRTCLWWNRIGGHPNIVLGKRQVWDFNDYICVSLSCIEYYYYIFILNKTQFFRKRNSVSAAYVVRCPYCVMHSMGCFQCLERKNNRFVDNVFVAIFAFEYMRVFDSWVFFAKVCICTF